MGLSTNKNINQGTVRGTLFGVAIFEFIVECALVLCFNQSDISANKAVLLALDLMSAAVLTVPLYLCYKGSAEGTRDGWWLTVISFCTSCLLFTDVLYAIFDGTPSARFVTIAASSLFVGLSVALSQSFYAYVGAIDANQKPHKTLDTLMWVVSACCYAAVLVNLFVPVLFAVSAEGSYHRAAGYPIWLVLIALLLGMCILRIIRADVSRGEKAALLGYMALPILSVCIQEVFGIVFIQNASEAVAILILMANIHVHRSEQYLRRQAQQSQELVKLEDARTRVVLSQIQPHFLYNTLASITYLCTKSPEDARNLSLDFTSYLRENLSVMDGGKLVPFEKEMEHVKTYLRIEEVRFGDRVHAEFNIAACDFMLPALTIEPLVENAVKHGICQKREGGTVSISVSEESDCYQIVVRDNGVGFEAGSWKDLDAEHVGLRSVSQRVEILCKGSLQIESIVGIGTAATLTIPKQEGEEQQ